MSAEPTTVYDRYNHDETLTTDDGEGIELWLCNRCGAVVRGLSMETHDDWHAALDRLVKGLPS